MNELSKIRRVMEKVIPDAPHEVLLVLDPYICCRRNDKSFRFNRGTFKQYRYRLLCPGNNMPDQYRNYLYQMQIWRKKRCLAECFLDLFKSQDTIFFNIPAGTKFNLHI